jgi:hypothetical protein
VKRLASDADFLAALEESHPYVRRVAAVLRSSGLAVTVPPTRVRPNIDVRHDYADGCDLLVERWRIEVKSRNLDFTGPGDYPFTTAFVNAASTWDRQPKPAAVILVSRLTLGLAVVPLSTIDQWTRRPIHHGPHDIDYDVLEAPRECLRPIAELIAWLKKCAG